MRTIRLLAAVLLMGVGQFSLRATILTVAYEHLDFTSKEAVQTKATWGGPVEYPLDFKADGLGNSSMSERSMIAVWVETAPIAVGTWKQPWNHADLSVKVNRFEGDDGHSCVSRVFVRHSPDRKHWTTWHALAFRPLAELRAEMERFKTREAELAGTRSSWSEADPIEWHSFAIFRCSLEIPRSTRARYEQLLAAFAKTNPPRPKFQEDAVRWILAREPDYFQKEIPFIGYLQFLIEANVGRSPRRLKTVVIDGLSLADGLAGHLTDTNRADYEGPWRFVAPQEASQTSLSLIK
jgi:hypothetical protein